MKNDQILSKLSLMASLAFATAFTIFCSSGNEANGGDSSPQQDYNSSAGGNTPSYGNSSGSYANGYDESCIIIGSLGGDAQVVCPSSSSRATASPSSSSGAGTSSSGNALSSSSALSSSGMASSGSSVMPSSSSMGYANVETCIIPPGTVAPPNGDCSFNTAAK